jgi:hypothetical protein
VPSQFTYSVVRAFVLVLLAVLFLAGPAPGQAKKHAKRVQHRNVKHITPRVAAKSRPAGRMRPAARSRLAAKRHPAVRILSPALVDSFRTIILTSCTGEDPEPLEISMREEMTRWLSVRYRRAGISMNGVDCSGFIKTLFGSTLFIDLPHSAAQQSLLGMPVDREELRFGDLIFFRAKKRISHVGIYLGEGYFVHSSRTFGVRVDPLFASRYYTKRFVRARRVASFADQGELMQE